MANPKGDGYFQQDNELHYAIRIVHEGDFIYQVATQSPDLNSVVLLWNEVVRAIRQMNSQPVLFIRYVVFASSFNTFWSNVKKIHSGIENKT